jgi:hypothetical protein
MSQTQTTTLPGQTVVTPVQSELSKILGLLFTMGTAAAAIFVKNPNHQQTAGSIISVLNQLLPGIEELL